MPATLSADEKTALDALNPWLELIFAEGGEYPGGTQVIKPMPGYLNPATAAHRDTIKGAFRATLVAFMRSGVGGSGTPGQGFTERGVWSSATTYNPYDVVEHHSGTWFAVDVSTNVVPGTNPTKWRLWAQGYSHRGNWLVGTTYLPNDLVTHNSGVWLGLTGSVGTAPGTNPSVWLAWSVSLGTDGAQIQPLGTQTLGNAIVAAPLNHVHTHGNQVGGSLHADVIPGGASGFMSGGMAQEVEDNLPTAPEKAALAGTAGAPSAMNKFVTQEDPRLNLIEPRTSDPPSPVVGQVWLRTDL